jgi:hypothetical protein
MKTQASPIPSDVVQLLRRMALEEAPIVEMIRAVLRETGRAPEISELYMIRAFREAFALSLEDALPVAASPIFPDSSRWTEAMVQGHVWPKVLKNKAQWT